MASYQRVVVGTDGSETSYKAVSRAAEIARESGARLILVTAYRPLSQREREASDRVGAGVDVDTIAAEGEPVDVLVRTAVDRKADLLVVGNRGLNTLTGRLLGSVPSVVTHRAQCDVLIVATT